MLGIFVDIDSLTDAIEGIVGLEMLGILGTGSLLFNVSFIANMCRLTR